MANVKLNRFGDKEKTQMNTAMIKILNRGINVLDATVKSKTPVDTGALRSDNIKTVDDGRLIAQESNNKEYAPHVEFGTRYQTAQPFLRSGLIESAPKIIRIAKQEAKKSIGS